LLNLKIKVKATLPWEKAAAGKHQSFATNVKIKGKATLPWGKEADKHQNFATNVAGMWIPITV
jgi:hypothetical protein